MSFEPHYINTYMIVSIIFIIFWANSCRILCGIIKQCLDLKLDDQINDINLKLPKRRKNRKRCKSF